MRVLGLLRSPLVAIDVGTAMTRVSFGTARVAERPSVAMRGGVVADISGVANVVGELLGRHRAWRRRPAAVVCAPTDVSPAERDALIEAVAEGGASVSAVVPEPLAAAVGIGVDVASEYATAVVDIGEGVTDFAVFRSGAIVHSHARRIGCGTLRAALRDWLGLPGDDAALESLVRAYCRSGPFGVDPANGLTRDHLEMLLEPELDAIASFIATTFRELPDALAAEIIESGIHVTGGGAKLGRLVHRIERLVGLPLARTGEPLTAVIRGATEMLRKRTLLLRPPLCSLCY